MNYNGFMNESNATNNTVKLMPEGFIEVRLVGEQDFQKIDLIPKEAQPIIDELQYAGKPVLALIDFTEDKSFNTGSNKAALGALERIPYRRVAMVGTNPLILVAARAIVAALGKSDNTKIFGSRDEAVAWLLNEPLVPGK